MTVPINPNLRYLLLMNNEVKNVTSRFSTVHIDEWRREGVVSIAEFFTPDEIAAVVEDFWKVFPGRQASAEAMVRKKDGQVGAFNRAQFNNFENIPFDCSPALNLLGVHPSLVALAKAALATDDIMIYQNQAWAKFTGEADFDQPFHCDFGNHTLTVPSDDEVLNAITFLVYFTDVSEGHGPTHFVTKTDAVSAGVPVATFSSDLNFQEKLQPFERSAAAPAGSVLAYGIDVYHRGTNLTIPNGYRFAVTSCFKKSDNNSIGYIAWPFHQDKPWKEMFNNGTPEQLKCFGVPLPGDSFWTKGTLAGAQSRYPDWDMQVYEQAMLPAASP
ncbi:MAG: phytanoyl-CoA dioxygenase family protein [Pseudomonadales bacterium]|jgi:hypothetical protein